MAYKICNIFSCMQRRTTGSWGKLRLLDWSNTEGIVRENPKNDDRLSCQ